MVGVQFTGIAGSTNISWDFNDGGVANILNPVHTFTAPGNYTVTYTATVNGSTVNQSIPIKFTVSQRQNSQPTVLLQVALQCL
jgi:PKD repeat protein